MISLEASAAQSLLAPGPTHLPRGEEWMKEESGRKSWVTLLEDVCFPLSVCCSLYIFVSTFFHFLPHVPGSSSVVLHVSALRIVSVSSVVRAERDDLGFMLSLSITSTHLLSYCISRLRVISNPVTFHKRDTLTECCLSLCWSSFHCEAPCCSVADCEYR